MTPEETARRLALAVAEYNENNPDSPITEADLRAKRRDGWLGKALLFCEGVWDGITDKIPENIARLFRHGEIGNSPDGWAERVIARQQQDQKARIPSYEEAIGDKDAASWYDSAAEIPTNVVAGLPGAVAGASLGILGGAAGSALTTGAVYGSIARDRFIEKMHEQFRAQYGRPPDGIEAAMLNGAAKRAANKYANEQALEEGAAQLVTAIPGGYAARGAGMAASRLLGRAGLAEPATIAGQALTRGAVRTAENITGESLSPEREFDAAQEFRGLNFLPQDMASAYQRDMRLRSALEPDYAPARNFRTQYIRQR